jgi:hypothetical protein
MSQPLRWTRERPKVEGWYWWRDLEATEDPSDGMIVYVYAANGGLYVDNDGDTVRLSTVHGEWAGPIEPPGEK